MYKEVYRPLQKEKIFTFQKTSSKHYRKKITHWKVQEWARLDQKEERPVTEDEPMAKDV